MNYKIVLLRDEGFPVAAEHQVWPTAEGVLNGLHHDKDEAEAAFYKFSGLEEYLEAHKPLNSDGIIYPLVLIAWTYSDETVTELDRFEPGLIFDGEDFDENDVRDYGYGMVQCSHGRREWYLFSDSEAAGDAAAERWREMAKSDPREFAALIGEKRLVQWALGELDDFGISSLDDFCDVTATVPEEEWASYDGVELDIDGVSQNVIDKIGFVPTVAYRNN